MWMSCQSRFTIAETEINRYSQSVIHVAISGNINFEKESK